MIRCTDFRFFLLQDENMINGKQPRVVYTVLSFFVLDSIMENKDRVIKFPFPFS